MKIRPLFIVPLVLLILSFSIPKKTEKKADRVIGKFYEIEAFQKEPVLLSDAANEMTVSEFANENLFTIKDGELFLGYGYIGNAPSKTATFDYLLLFDKDFIITKSKVLIYREEYGGEIGSKRWLKQFIGKASTSPIINWESDIIPISGATISVRSMTNAINDVLQSLAKLQKNDLL